MPRGKADRARHANSATTPVIPHLARSSTVTVVDTPVGKVRETMLTFSPRIRQQSFGEIP